MPAIVDHEASAGREEQVEYLQLRPTRLVSLAEQSKRVDANGRTALVKPFVLRSVPVSDSIDIAALAENPSVVVFSDSVQQCLRRIDPLLDFDEVRFEDEPPSPRKLPAVPRPVPTREELLASLNKSKLS